MLHKVALIEIQLLKKKMFFAFETFMLNNIINWS